MLFFYRVCDYYYGILYIGIALSVIGTKSYHINADNTTALVLVIKQTLGVQFAWVIGFVALSFV